MSEVTTRDGNRNQLFADRENLKIFTRNNEFIPAVFNNNTGGDIDLVGGEVLGRIPGTNKAVILASAAVDGSAIPVGINKTCATVLDGADEDIFICVSGNVAEEKLIFDGSDTMDTVITLRTLRDRIMGDTMGILPRLGDEQTEFDN